ncbi:MULTISPECIES: type II toxin-antitoxin system RelE/ParE family toxin [Leptospira]|uniref:Type II toxin-antitoxin system RelE/ParE family toxin n=2 Tax=Leptospira TaxID=171 RepID=A0A6N4QUL7_9LEPT|nr:MULTISPECIES: type II toxin-antitoxin system RelE/ParE family toxin [Leptospira]AYV57701.1 type II toxin-antitoxin system RelE/ParE family toxin [Leptospira kmetyi]TGL76000.1 type II toxin-antitoxin system RelE/ParE family toxin [Leptospira yasudae]TGL79728.1 type II toxin-antitoxin system RelE/ParE family toxin [Leptospira yasudae]TGL80116.1 type II toxin-antitoxin system RelE/ParE family toxin [Leptospira yasudae]
MINSFNSKETEKIWNQEFSKKLPNQIQALAYRKLVMIARSKHVEDLKIPPANHLEKLSGNRAGQHSIRINDQWRICFKWKDGNAYDVEIVDYH